MAKALTKSQSADSVAETVGLTLCGLTPRQTVRVEWHHRGIEGVS
jgi:hypothetical protein